MISIQGKGVSSGVGVGPLYFYHRTKTEIPRYTVTDPDAEWHRFKGAQTAAIEQLGELTEKARSDVNILAVVNPQTKQVALINTPRDYYVDLAGTNSKDKLTHAGLYGVETSMATLGNLYGVNVGHYISINFAGFIKIVDALGGVDEYT